MRLGLAGVVAFVHALAVGFGHQPQVNGTTLGDLAVDGFFVLSGFLVTASLLRTRSVSRYLWHRALRIMPAFWVCLLVLAVLVAPVLALLQGRAPLSVWTAEQDSAGAFLVRNGALLIQQWGIAGLPVGVPEPGVLDGSLWTLFYEAVCYGLVVVLAVLGALRRPALLAGLVVALWGLTIAEAAGAWCTRSACCASRCCSCSVLLPSWPPTGWCCGGGCWPRRWPPSPSASSG
jgi:peptidoglycan/LPS O-acetylase OafA/YrhL